jgi:hypothetical protein
MAKGDPREPGHAWRKSFSIEPSGYSRDPGRPKRKARTYGQDLEAGWRRRIFRARKTGNPTPVLSGLDAGFMRRTRFEDLPVDEEEFAGLFAGGVDLALSCGAASSFHPFVEEAYAVLELLFWSEHEAAMAEEFEGEGVYTWSRG